MAVIERPPASTSTMLGAAAALSVVGIWATWLISMRYSRGGMLTPLDLSLLRFGIPALVLSPFLRRTGLWPRSAGTLPLVLMIVGAGAPFFQVAAFGLHATPASAAGVLLPGTMPLATALIGMLVLGERPDRLRKIGMLAILAGGLMLLIGTASGAALTWRSYLVMPFGAVLWAVYTHAFRRSGLGAFEAGALICFWSTVINLPLIPLMGSNLLVAPVSEIALQIVPQGLLSGLLATVLYGIGVRMLGATKAAAYTAVTPVAAAIGGAVLLREPVDALTIAATFVTGLGVLLSTGLLSRRRT
ncbi:DMT family transporter [Pseudorhizobium flavum]|uniref:Drug/metabolite transporter (DMT)-like permease n=1 Tax=Pseudorhizobium flavum TaxID=1335061 RepID=A0A7W9YYY3_9HYPH|nr:DMT family transporter [Pseudorhizobium flavum]MBB6180817.1 drug/metabolite transporter (DMT)-like permease [Pseudorhizobium flavum]CAD6602481.1 EamA/RhaT family transporter [Pseudorhizobium flavum]